MVFKSMRDRLKPALNLVDFPPFFSSRDGESNCRGPAFERFAGWRLEKNNSKPSNHEAGSRPCRDRARIRV